MIDLARRSGNLLLFDAPAGVEVVIDMFTFEPGPLCLGVKLLCPGMHLLASAPCVEGIRSWLWFEILEGGGTHVARWSVDDEAFAIVASAPQAAKPCVCGSAGDEALMHSARLLELDARLGVLPPDGVAAWAALTRRVTRKVVERIAPSYRGIATDGSPLTADVSPGVAAELAVDKASACTGVTAAVLAAPGAVALHFTRIRGICATDGAAARAAHALDTSASFLTAAAAASSGDALLGELEAAFVLTLIAQSFAALEAWKGLSDAACRAGDLLTGRGGEKAEAAALGPQFFTSLFTVLATQLRTLPPDFFGADIARGAFLAPALSALLRAAREAVHDMALPPDAPFAAPAIRIAVGKLLAVAQDHCAWKPLVRNAALDIAALAAGRPLAVSLSEGGGGEAIDLQTLLQALIEEGGDDDGPALVAQEEGWVL